MCLGWNRHPWGQRWSTTGRVEQSQSGQRRADGLSRGRLGLGRHEWSFGKRGSVMTQEVLGSLPERGSRTGRAVLRWTNASRLMMRKTSTDNVPHRPQQELPKHNPALNSRCGKCQKASRAMRRSPLSKSTRRETRRASSHKVNQIAERQRKRKR